MSEYTYNLIENVSVYMYVTHKKQGNGFIPSGLNQTRCFPLRGEHLASGNYRHELNLSFNLILQIAIVSSMFSFCLSKRSQKTVGFWTCFDHSNANVAAKRALSQEGACLSADTQIRSEESLKFEH